MVLACLSFLPLHTFPFPSSPPPPPLLSSLPPSPSLPPSLLSSPPLPPSLSPGLSVPPHAAVKVVRQVVEDSGQIQVNLRERKKVEDEREEGGCVIWKNSNYVSPWSFPSPPLPSPSPPPPPPFPSPPSLAPPSPSPSPPPPLLLPSSSPPLPSPPHGLLAIRHHSRPDAAHG